MRAMTDERVRRTVARNLKTLRRRACYNQTQMAHRLFLKRGTYASYEETRSAPAVETLLLIGALFGVSLDQLLTTTLKR